MSALSPARPDPSQEIERPPPPPPPSSHRRRRARAGPLTLAAAAVTLAWVATVWSAPHIEVGPAVHRLALFCHLAALVAGFGAVLTMDWLGLKWMLGRIDLGTLLRTAHDTHLLIWLGLSGLAASGVLLSPDTSAPLTRVKLVAVLIVGLNGLYVGRLQGQLGRCVGRPTTPLLLRGAAAAFTSQACWWTATTVGFLSSLQR
jgi:hypothetical protein